MRVCFVLNQFPELSQTFVLHPILELMERGVAVDVIAARSGDAAEYHASLGAAHRAELARRTTYTQMPDRLPARVVRGAWLLFAHAFRHRRALRVGLSARRFGWFAVTGSLLSMGLPLADQPREYDAIVAHFGPQGMLAQGLREMGLLRGPLVTFFHAYDLTSAPRLAGRRMYARLFECGESFLTVSHRGADQIIALGAPATRVNVHHMGVDAQFFSPPEVRTPRAGRRVISIGRLVSKKGFEHGLRAVANAKARGVHLEYSIYGAGPMRLPLERAIDAMGLRGIAKLRGPATQDELATALRESDILIAPSITSADGDEEGIPVVLMEAMATGLPVVATDCGAIDELVRNDKSGLLVRQGDVDGLSDALCRLSVSADLAERLGRAGRERVLQEFERREQGRRLVEHLERLAYERYSVGLS